MHLNELMKGLEHEYIQGSDKEITNIAYNSSKIKENGLFVCITGFKSDGHRYAESAVTNGAITLIVEKKIEYISKDVTVIKVKNSRSALAVISANFYNHPEKNLRITGVTGTNGKTSTTYLLNEVLKLDNKKTGIIGTIENRIGDKVIHTEHTTPESLELSGLFSQMKEACINDVVMEVSSHSLELHRVDAINFEVGIFTNLTQDHLEFHQTMEGYLQAKAKLFKKCKYGIFNIDDLWAERIINSSECEVFTFAIDNKKADICAYDVLLDNDGVKFKIDYSGKTYEFFLAIPARFTVYNALGVIGAAIKLNIPMETIAQGLENVKGIPGRAQTLKSHLGFSAIVDFAHTPDALSNVLKSVRSNYKGRLITVFGCGGDRDKTKRPIMGEIVGELSDFAIITSDNPRSENPTKIIDEIEAGLKTTDCPYEIFVNRREAIVYALSIAEKGDAIVIAGKGHENYQIIGDQVLHFDDVEVVAEELQKLK